MMRKIEILAPAGSVDSLKAAINASCDAVYIGGNRFGARAFADNPNEKEMLLAMEYVHLHGKKLYMTVNTLLKEEEIEKDLYSYIKPYYEQGLDAVIVQDLGAANFIHDKFPNLKLHASTQMTLTTAYPESILKSLGVTRFVPARELSINEIAKMRKNTDLEIECFVHGALCYCYSGQCLLSSIIGGRSGNRGRCAQPCRMQYTRELSGKKEYILSPKDICTLDIIPDMVEAGIDSFKIEGRMKRPEYTALCAFLYGKYTDLYLEKGREGYERFLSDHKKEFEMDKLSLAELYNRGGFSTGYYNQYHGKEMMSMKRPNHYGVLVGNVVECNEYKAKIKLVKDIKGQDVLEFRDQSELLKYDYTVGSAEKEGNEIWANYKRGSNIRKGDFVYRTKNQTLIEKIQEDFIHQDKKVEITGSFLCKVGEPLRLALSYKKFHVQEAGACVQEAKNHPLEEKKIVEAIGKLGDTNFVFKELKGELSENAFLPIGDMKQLRRNALAALEEEIRKEYKRAVPKTEEEQIKEEQIKSFNKKEREPYQKEIRIQVTVETREQFEIAEKISEVARIYAPMDVLCSRKMNKEYYIAMPYIFREEVWNSFKMDLSNVDGYLIRNQEEVVFLENNHWNGKKMLDTNMYTFNSYAKQFWQKRGIEDFMIPVELNKKEIMQRGTKGDTLLVYGHLPLMISAQCLVDNCNTCKKQSGMQVISDRKGKSYFVFNCCEYCYNVIYDGEAYSLLDEKEAIQEMKIETIRLDFTTESAEEMQKVLRNFIDQFRYNRETPAKETNYKGHFRRGVE